MEDGSVFLVPRVGLLLYSSDLEAILSNVVHTMGYDGATDEQKGVVEAFVRGKDVFVSLPTGRYAAAI